MFGRLVGVREGVAYWRKKLALRTWLRNLNSFRDIRVHIYEFLKIVGVKVGVVPSWNKIALHKKLRNLHAKSQ